MPGPPTHFSLSNSAACNKGALPQLSGTNVQALQQVTAFFAWSRKPRSSVPYAVRMLRPLANAKVCEAQDPVVWSACRVEELGLLRLRRGLAVAAPDHADAASKLC